MGKKELMRAREARYRMVASRLAERGYRCASAHSGRRIDGWLRDRSIPFLDTVVELWVGPGGKTRLVWLDERGGIEVYAPLTEDNDMRVLLEAI